MRARQSPFLAVLAFLCLAAPPSARPEEPAFVVVVHPSNPAQSITRQQLADLFLKKVTQWPAGDTIHPVEPPETSRTRANFASDVMGKSPAALKTLWNKRIFAGREVPPVEKRSDDEVVGFVRGTPGAVGYVSRGVATAGVKVLELRD